MRPYEFQFNPGLERDLIFDSFCYSPENIYERRMGGIFMVGEIKKALPHNYRLLDKIAACMKKEFYSKFQRTHEQALKESLRKANELLSAEVSRDNTDWLGNLGFAIISLKNFELNFTKIGGVKMFLLRGSHIIDIGEKLDKQEIEPYPLKVFNNIVSGKLGDGDMIVLVTEGIFPSLKSLIKEISEAPIFDEKKIRISLERKRAELANFSGTLVLIAVTKDTQCQKRPKIVFEREVEGFSMSEALLPLARIPRKIFSLLKKIPIYAKTIKPKFNFSFKIPNLKGKKEEIIEETVPVKKPSGPIKVKVKVETDDKKPSPKIFQRLKIGLKLPRFKIPKLHFSFNPSTSLRIKPPKIKIPRFRRSDFFNKRYLSLVLFAIMLVIGFYSFQGQQKREQEEYKSALDSIMEKVIEAESLMPLKDVNVQAENSANSSLSEAWSEIIPLTKMEWAYKQEALVLKSQIETDLKNLSNLVKVDSPETVFQFNSDKFIPQRMITDGEENLYFFSPYVQNVFSVDTSFHGTLFVSDKKFNSAAALSQNNLLFFAKPNEFTAFSGGLFDGTFSLKSPYSDYNFSDLAYFEGNFYFLDSDNGQIIKYATPLSDGKDHPLKWLHDGAEQPLNAKAITVDGSIWTLNGDNSISEYRAGNLQQKITLDIFPAAKGFSRIKTSSDVSYVFILEAAQNRVIIMDKQGNLIKQLQSDSFDNLLDLAISKDGKTIFILNGLKIYKISI
jgi:aromatic ring-opening dioxygenase LigB subunit